MDFREFARELGIVGKVLSITRKNGVKTYCPVTKGCALRVLNDAMAGETVCLSEDVVPCNGGKYGFGFSDASMRVPGGYGHFISYGAGEGFPAGMRLKCDPELAERDALAKPKGVMDGYSAIEIKPFEESGGESDIPDLVTIAATPDSLSALNLLFHFRRLGDDLTFFPSGSGCASIFRLPFGELAKDNPRAVIGNADVSSRPFFDANTLFFTVAGEIFETMLQDTDKSFLAASAWKKLKERV